MTYYFWVSYETAAHWIVVCGRVLFGFVDVVLEPAWLRWTTLVMTCRQADWALWVELRRFVWVW